MREEFGFSRGRSASRARSRGLGTQACFGRACGVVDVHVRARNHLWVEAARPGGRAAAAAAKTEGAQEVGAPFTPVRRYSISHGSPVARAFPPDLHWWRQVLGASTKTPCQPAPIDFSAGTPDCLIHAALPHPIPTAPSGRGGASRRGPEVVRGPANETSPRLGKTQLRGCFLRSMRLWARAKPAKNVCVGPSRDRHFASGKVPAVGKTGPAQESGTARYFGFKRPPLSDRTPAQDSAAARSPRDATTDFPALALRLASAVQGPVSQSSGVAIIGHAPSGSTSRTNCGHRVGPVSRKKTRLDFTAKPLETLMLRRDLFLKRPDLAQAIARAVRSDHPPFPNRARRPFAKKRLASRAAG